MVDWVILSVVFIASIILTGALRYYALKMSILDIPGNRSSHTVPTPRGGGLSFVIIISVAIVFLYIKKQIDIDIFMSLIVGGLLVAGIGFWDDHKHIPAIWRLMVHLAASVWAIFWLYNNFEVLTDNTFSSLRYLVYLAAIFYVIWVLNLFNFMDGIDGIASVEAISIGIIAALIIWFNTNNIETSGVFSKQVSEGSIFLLLLISLSTLGFLIWNWPPAKIFMGDVGSGYLGYVLSITAIYTIINDNLTIWVWLILMGVFLIDATFTLLKRFVSGERWYEAHRSHAYQHAAQKYNSHKKVTLAVLLINILWLGPLAGISKLIPEYEIIIAVIAYIPLILLALKYKAGSLYKEKIT